MTDIRHRTVQTNGINMHIAEAGEGPLVLLVHGFPELWYSWRHQLPALAEAGYHAVAPDVRGYGRTDQPYEIEAYAMRQHVADAVGVLGALGQVSAVVVGHDWGSPIAWHCALLAPERFRAVAALSVPFQPRPPAPPTQVFKRRFGDRFFYILYFQEPGKAERELEADPRRTMRVFLYAASGDAPRGAAGPQKSKDATFLEGMPEPEELPAWLTEDDIETFASEFARTGFRGALNRYRNMDRDWADLAELDRANVRQPALFIGGERDAVLAFTSLDPMKQHVPDLRGLVMLPGCGHWTQQERPAEVNAALIDFLKGL